MWSSLRRGLQKNYKSQAGFVVHHSQSGQSATPLRRIFVSEKLYSWLTHPPVDAPSLKRRDLGGELLNILI